ncbi:MAG: hypothetical protein IJZ55_01645 [Lachnospiraceae bacterium]|nr:hypothetical protein [Lachnospiraceae bacterium]
MNKKLKTYVTNKGLKLYRNLAYGNLHGYAATVTELSGTLQIVFNTSFSDEQNAQTVQSMVSEHINSKEYKLQNAIFSNQSITLYFICSTTSHITKIDAFLTWLCPLLDRYSARPISICPECNGEITDGHWKLIDDIAYYMHRDCGTILERDLVSAHQAHLENDTGNYLTGLIGSLLGAILGGVVWGLVLMLGRVASVVGLLIGWLSYKGYNLFNGKQNKGKIVIMALSVIFGVLFGNFFSDAITLLKEGLTLAELPEAFAFLFTLDEYKSPTIYNIVLGLIFAAVGSYSMLRTAGKEVSGSKIVDLD